MSNTRGQGPKSVDPETCTAVIALNATNNNKRIFGHRANVTVQLA
ncbi:hypothetical protein [Antrihabitans spumae]|uniref:Uncharacterized protein n=1 Tax=Antrihabitans spumae TaxID=3373370 RepID=A0ABW7KU78_9NOCA